MRKVVDHLGEGRLFQIGIRSGTEDEFKLARRMKSIVSLDPLSLSSMIKRLRNQPVYITLDLDVIDPSLLPGVGTPEPGGLTFQELISLLKKLQTLHVVGFDMVELTPDYDHPISSLRHRHLERDDLACFDQLLRKPFLTFCLTQNVISIALFSQREGMKL
jgi:arginase family enzyme